MDPVVLSQKVKKKKKKSKSKKSKKRKLSQLTLSLPSAVLPERAAYGASAPNIIANAQHGGRVRGFKHVPGNFATHVRLKLAGETATLCLSELGCTLMQAQPQNLWTAHSPEELHISLSHTVPLRRHEIEPFVKSLRQEIGTLTLPAPLPVTLQSVRFLCNAQRSRAFAGVCASASEGELLQLLRCVNTVFKKYGQPVYYHDATLHMSTHWTTAVDKVFAQPATTATTALPQVAEEEEKQVLPLLLPEWVILETTCETAGVTSLACLECVVGDRIALRIDLS